MKNFKAIALSLGLAFIAPLAQAQTQVLIKTSPFEKLPAMPYVEKSPAQIQQEEQTRTFVPIYGKNHLNFYPSQKYPLPLYGNWGLRPIHRYGCRTGDIVIVNAKGVEKKFPIKTERTNSDAREWDKVNPIDCPAQAAPRLINSWIMNSRYIAFETSDPGFVLFDFVKGEFVNHLVLKPDNYPVILKSGIDGTIFFHAPKIPTVEQNRYFTDTEGKPIRAALDTSNHRFAFAFREMYMCQEALSWGEPCTDIKQLRSIFAR